MSVGARLVTVTIMVNLTSIQFIHRRDSLLSVTFALFQKHSLASYHESHGLVEIVLVDCVGITAI